MSTALLRPRALLLAVVGAAFVAGGVGRADPSARTSDRVRAGAAACSPTWANVPSPNVATGDVLIGIAAVTASDIWAVGDYNVNHTVARTLALHWDGTAWTVVPTPNSTGGDDLLNSVAVLPSGELIAVGNATRLKLTQTLIERWDGTSWTVVPAVPNPGQVVNHLYGVSVASSSDVWAVGDYQGADGQSRGLILHFDGASWSQVPSPAVGSGSSYLRSVAVVATDDVWAVGQASDGGAFQTLIEHWDGSSWSVVPSPEAGTGNNFLIGVSATAANDVWAAGEAATPTGLRPLVEHWDGSSWSVVPTPTPTIADARLYGIFAAGQGDAWTVGSFFSPSAQANRPLILHWGGASWTITPSAPISGQAGLSSITTTPAGDVWTVGVRSGHTLIEHSCPA